MTTTQVTSYSNRILTPVHINKLDVRENPELGNEYEKDEKLIDLYLNSLNSHNIMKSSIFEMELRFNQFKREYGGVANTLNKQQFNDIIELFSNYQNTIDIRGSAHPQYSLDITVHSNNYVDLSDDISKLRFTINSKPKIGEFCRNNKINLKDSSTSVIYKGNLPDTIINDEFSNLIDSYTFGDLQKTHNTIDLESFKARLGGKFELEYNPNTRQFKYGSEFDNPLVQELNKDAQIAMNKYMSLDKKNRGRTFKTFRLKERYSFKLGHCQIDLTKVKFSKVDIDTYYRENQIPVLEFIDSGLSDSIESYEFEIEIVDRAELTKEEIRGEIMTALDLYILATSAAKERLLFTNNIVSNDVKELYKKMLKNLILKRINKKLDDIGNADLQPNDIPWSNETLIFNMNTESKAQLRNKLIRLKSKYEDPDYEIDRYISPKVISMSMDHVREDNPESIHHQYSVTDKADGLSSLLFVVGDEFLEEYEKEKYRYLFGKAFLIDSNLGVNFTGLSYPDVRKTYLFNGEFLNYTKHRKILNKYGIYDTYIENGEDVHNLPLITNDESQKTRIKIANDFLEQNEGEAWAHEHVDIFVKKFYVANKPIIDIFQLSKDIWSSADSKPYKLDGLIYTPSLIPSGYNETIEYDLNPWITWDKNYKWKPPEDNTIDFLLRFDQELVSSFNNNNIYKFKTKSFKSPVTSAFDTYLIGNLFNTGKEGMPKSNPCKPGKKIDFRKYKTKPIPFNPEHPIQDDIHFGYFLADYNGNVLDLEGNQVESDTVVEINYMDFSPSSPDYKPNKNMRFNILRTRHDKTYEHRIATNEQKTRFRRISRIIDIVDNNDGNKLSRNEKNFVRRYRNYFGSFMRGFDIDKDERSYIRQFKKLLPKIKKVYSSYEDIDFSNIKLNYGNAVSVANNIWATIHNPVTTEIITTGDNIPSLDEEEKKYYNRKDNEQKDKSITYNLQTFHNKVIKSRLLLENAVNALRKDDSERHISLLDLACGKGGDIGKWNNLNINNCVGIDIVYNNINDNIDGACERYNFYTNKLGKHNVSDMKFLVGDISQNILDMTAFNKHPEYKKDAEKLWITSDGPRYIENKFDIISTMFSLHYLFENKQKLDGFIQNISDNLSNDGYFIGACLDGKEIYKKLEAHLRYESIEGYKDGSWIWKIIKNYDNFEDGLPDNDESLGISIKVAMRSINKVIEEYLVNFEYFISELGKKGISLVEDEKLDSMNLPIKMGSKISVGSFKDVFEMPTDEASKFNSILSDVKQSMTDEEKEISFFNKYFIFTRKSDNRLIIENMKEHIYVKLSGKGRKPNDQTIKDYVSVKLSIMQDDQFETNFQIAKQMAVSQIESEKKKKVKVLKVKKKPSVSEDDVSVSSAAASSSTDTSVAVSTASSTMSSKKGISIGKIKSTKKKTIKKSLSSEKSWKKVGKAIDVIYKNYLTIKKDDGKVPKKDFDKIIKHITKIKALSEKPEISNNPEFASEISRVNELHEYFTNSDNITII